MIEFLINIYKLIRAVWTGCKTDEEFRILLFFLSIQIFGSTLFYCEIENWSIIDSVYFSVMTMATIGYGDLVPTTDFSKIFTILNTFLGIGLFASVVTKIVRLIVVKKKN